MGLFDFLKGKKQDTIPKKAPGLQQQETAQDGPATVQYERKLTAREITSDSHLIEAIVEKMVVEDPFQNYFKGRSDQDIRSRIYEYEEITTMNVGILLEEKAALNLYVEGILLGTIPERIADELNRYQGQNLLTAYAYVTGGRYKEYSAESATVVEGTAPYGLDIYLQYT